jgi:hypothetical protein
VFECAVFSFLTSNTPDSLNWSNIWSVNFSDSSYSEVWLSTNGIEIDFMWGGIEPANEYIPHEKLINENINK